MTNPFVLEKNQYKRDINPIGHYFEQAASYLEIMTGKPRDECLAYAKAAVKSNRLSKVIDPKIVYLDRQDNGDRIQLEGTLMGYINDSLKDNELIAPTLTTYINPSVKESLLVQYVEDNVAARGVAKKAQFAAEAAGDKPLATIKNTEQTNVKLKNNAVSGAHVSASTPLSNKTAHSTLTSTCRSTSGNGNANNEKFLSGNRHYWSPDIVINNIISIVTHTDYVKLGAVVEKYKLSNISVDQAMECVLYSTNLYWLSNKAEYDIRKLITSLTGLQRQAFVYTGDMYHLMKHNPDFIRNFLTEISIKVTGECPDALTKLGAINEDIINLAHQVCLTEMKGKGKNHKAMVGTKELEILTLTALNIESVLNKYFDLIRGLWVSDNFPASVAYFPESIRRAALTSDTDSTIFTVQDWVIWFKGGISFDNEAMRIAATMIFLASQSITHILAKMSANFGIIEKRLHQIAMKNEFKFDVFVPTQVAKHYYAIISCQEGNVKPELEKEIKGVHLKSSNAPLKITKQATKLMEDIMSTVMAGKKISLLKILKEIGDTERTIYNSIKSGELEYFRLGQIKEASSYTTGERVSPYSHYLFWNEVFADKYGVIPPPPYTCIKVSTVLNNPSAVKQWLETMKDKDIAKKIESWMIANNKKAIPTLMLSAELVKANGIPEEIVSIIDTRSIVSGLSKIFYLIAETLGFYINTDKNINLISDTY